MISTAQTGFFYTTQRVRQSPRLSAIKYDPRGAPVTYFFGPIFWPFWTLFQWNNGCYLSRVRKRKSRPCHTQVSLLLVHVWTHEWAKLERAAVYLLISDHHNLKQFIWRYHTSYTVPGLWAILFYQHSTTRTLAMRFERDFHHTCKEEERTCESGSLLYILCSQAAADL